MFNSLIPDINFKSVFEITPEFLRKHDIKLLLTDLDNTLAPYTGAAPNEELFRWKDRLKSAGIEIFIVSNTRSERARLFSEKWGVPYVNNSRKPKPDVISRVVSNMGMTRRNTALVGDQIFTDVWGANRAGVLSIAVKPLVLKNVFFILRYIAELPFRASAKNML